VAEWRADAVVDEALARRLIAAQAPELELSSLELLGEGWDNTVWLVDGDWVFRFPRREIAVPGIARQVTVLPALAPALPIPIPVPVVAGRPAEGFPWPFTGHRLLPGLEPADTGVTDEDRAAWARPLGEFLRALHDPALLELDGVVELPIDANRRADMHLRCDMLRSRLAELAELELWEPPPLVRGLIGAAERLDEPEALAVAHGDLHLRHVLVEGGRPTAVIDWDDLCRADPAIDLVPYWSHLPATARPAFLKAYGDPTEAQLLRARVLSLFLAGTLAVYARREGLPRLERESLGSLDRTVSG
jgi:aminoglycoside phosphotransferase (APT) family kinase protein